MHSVAHVMYIFHSGSGVAFARRWTRRGSQRTERAWRCASRRVGGAPESSAPSEVSFRSARGTRIGVTPHGSKCWQPRAPSLSVATAGRYDRNQGMEDAVKIEL